MLRILYRQIVQWPLFSQSFQWLLFLLKWILCKETALGVFLSWMTPEAIKKYKSKVNKKHSPQNEETSGKCPSIAAKKNDNWFCFLPQMTAPASGQWPEISPKEIPDIHHRHTLASRILKQECRKIVLAKWNLTVSKVFPSSEADRKPRAELNSYRLVFQLYVIIVKHHRRETRDCTALWKSKAYKAVPKQKTMYTDFLRDCSATVPVIGISW